MAGDEAYNGGEVGVKVDVNALHFLGQNLLIWPALLQLKHSPFLIMSIHLSVFKASMSIVSGSLHRMLHFCLGSSFVFSEVFPVDRPNIRCILLKLLSSLLAQLYHSFKSLGRVGSQRRSLCKGIGNDLIK